MITGILKAWKQRRKTDTQEQRRETQAWTKEEREGTRSKRLPVLQAPVPLSPAEFPNLAYSCRIEAEKCVPNTALYFPCRSVLVSKTILEIPVNCFHQTRYHTVPVMQHWVYVHHVAVTPQQQWTRPGVTNTTAGSSKSRPEDTHTTHTVPLPRACWIT